MTATLEYIHARESALPACERTMRVRGMRQLTADHSPDVAVRLLALGYSPERIREMPARHAELLIQAADLRDFRVLPPGPQLPELPLVEHGQGRDGSEVSSSAATWLLVAAAGAVCLVALAVKGCAP